MLKKKVILLKKAFVVSEKNALKQTVHFRILKEAKKIKRTKQNKKKIYFQIIK
jgi:hypothetical protein